MTAAPRAEHRPAFTLVELLVAMAIAVALASIALVVVPGAMEQDRTTDGAATVRSQLMIAKARALRDNAPRGIRFLVGSDPTNAAKTNVLWSTELQQIEQPPPYLVNATGNTSSTAPCIEFVYTIAPAPTPPNTTPVQGSISNRQCFLRNLQLLPATISPPTPDVVVLIQNDIAAGLTPRLFVPTLGSLYVSGISAAGTDWQLQFNPSPWPDVDAVMGAGGTTSGTGKRYFTFALFLAPRPLIGEPTTQLPKNICVDLLSSLPASTGTTNYDIIFAPNGQVLYRSEGQIFLWVRDFTKNGGKNSGTSPPYPSAMYEQGGEQQIVALKTKAGSLGVYPVMWPPYNFAAGMDEYTFARNSR